MSYGLSFSFKSVYERYKNDDECHHKQTFYIPPITQSIDTITVGRELLSLSYVMDGVEKSCLRHKYYPQPDETVKNRQHFP